MDFASETSRALFGGTHHARYVDQNVPLHVISRVFQGRHLLRPSPVLNAIVIGVVGRALELHPNVSLYAMAFLSNHVHFMLRGGCDEIPSFVGFVKREISRRWGHRPEVNWSGTMWHEYIATALPTPESQVACLKYVLSQGVKEGLVARPEEWPGVHCATSLSTGEALRGTWLNATAYSRAVDAQKRRRAPRQVLRESYEVDYRVTFATLPSWCGLSEVERFLKVRALIAEVVAEGARDRAGREPLGRRRIARVALNHRTELPQVPWLVRRRRMICWAVCNSAETSLYVKAYWDFQIAFRSASQRDVERRTDAFPPGAFMPGRWLRTQTNGVAA